MGYFWLSSPHFPLSPNRSKRKISLENPQMLRPTRVQSSSETKCECMKRLDTLGSSTCAMCTCACLERMYYVVCIMLCGSGAHTRISMYMMAN